MKKFFVLILAVLAFALVSCGGGAPDVTYVSESFQGLTFERPDNWLTKETDSGQLNVVSDQKLLDDTSASFAGGGALNITPAPLDSLGQGTAVELLTQVAGFMADEKTTQTKEPTAVTIQGQEAAQAEFSVKDGDNTATLVITLIKGNTQVAVMAGVYDDASYADILKHIVESTKVGDAPAAP